MALTSPFLLVDLKVINTVTLAKRLKSPSEDWGLAVIKGLAGYFSSIGILDK